MPSTRWKNYAPASVGAAIAAVHGTTVERVALHTSRNARALYRLDARESR